MSTQPNPTPTTPLSVDDAFSAVKTDEGTLAGAQTAATSAQSALDAAQAQLATAQTSLSQAKSQAVADLDALIQAAQAAKDAINPPAQLAG